MSQKRFKIEMYFTDNLDDPTVKYGETSKTCEISDILSNARIDIGMEVTSLFIELYKHIPAYSPIYLHKWELARLILRKLARSIYVWKVFTQPLYTHTVWATDKNTIWYLCMNITSMDENNTDESD